MLISVSVIFGGSGAAFFCLVVPTAMFRTIQGGGCAALNMHATTSSARILVAVMLVLVAVPLTAGQDTTEPAWRSNGLDPLLWEDRPETEDSPMMESYTGNAVIELRVSYQEGHLSSQTEGEIIIELFEEWAPITTANMIEHVESGLYDGIFFHRVINDFVTQSGDPTCKTVGAYPATSLTCGSGGTGETIPLELNENLSHVDGALGMARGQDPDSADAQWYIAETEAHNLDPENRDDEGYATFGIVRDGMSHIRAIACTPTNDAPLGCELLENPASAAGRPVYEAKINSMQMIGVADPDGTIRNPADDTTPASTEELESQSLFQAIAGNSINLVAIAILLGGFVAWQARIEPPLLMQEEAKILDAELVDDRPLG